MGDFFTTMARVSGAFTAIIAAWAAVQVPVHAFNQEPYGGDLLGAIFAGIMATVLLGVRDEEPPKSDGPGKD